MKVFLHPAAEHDAEEAQGWYQQRSPLAARAFLTELIDAIVHLGTPPLLGSSYLAGTRRSFLSTFPFSLIYRTEAERVVVIATAHHRRKLGYWLQRH